MPRATPVHPPICGMCVYIYIHTVYKAEECGRRRVTRNSFRVTQKETKQRNLMTYKKTSYQDSINKDLKIVSSILQCKNLFLKTSYLDT